MNKNSIVSLEELVPGYPVVTVNHPTCRARVALHGAHVMSWCPTGHEEVLYLSPEAVYREGKAIRGGIPICWPWFNACLLYTSPSPRDGLLSRMPSSA